MSPLKQNRSIHLTSFPTVMEAMTFFTASFFFSFRSEFNSALSSNISPFFVVVKYLESVIFDILTSDVLGQQMLTSSKLEKGLLHLKNFRDNQNFNFKPDLVVQHLNWLWLKVQSETILIQIKVLINIKQD